MGVLAAYPVVKKASALLQRPAISPHFQHALLKGLTLASVLAPFPAAKREYVFQQLPAPFLLLLRAQPVMNVLQLAAATWESAHPPRAVTYPILLLSALITAPFRIMDVLLP